MINFKLRQEKNGGHLFDCSRGTVTVLSQAQYDFLRHLHEAGGNLCDWPQAGIQQYFPGNPEAGWQWWSTLEALHLARYSAIEDLRHIPYLDDPEGVPGDCLAAPARVYFELTRRCNLSCKTCFNESHIPLDNELTTAEIMNILDQLDKLGTFEIRFTGGEPTEHPDFREIVKYARELGFYISLGTNGVYSDAKRDWVYDAGIDWFILSLDGDEDVNDRIRGTGTYRQVVRTLRELTQLAHSRVRLNMVVGRHNFHCIAAVAQLAEDYHVESLNMIPLRPYGRSVKMMKDTMFSQHDFYHFIQHIQTLRHQYHVQFITTLDLLDPKATTSHDPVVQKKRACAAGVEATVIGASGDVYGCSYSPASFPDSPDIEGRRIFVAGNIRQDSVRTIWRDSSRWAVFRQLDQYRPSRCFACLHYGVRCVGACPIMGYFVEGRPDALDPYCFVDLMTDSP